MNAAPGNEMPIERLESRGYFEKPRSLTNAKIAFAIGVILVAAFIGIFDHDLWGPDEPRTAEIGREFLEKGNSPAIPRLNREPFMEQPPPYYWCLAITYKIFGGHGDHVARIPSVLFGLLTVLITFMFARKLFGVEVAAGSAIILSLTYEYFIVMHRCITDPCLVFFVTLSFFFLHGAIHGKGRAKLLYYVLYYLAAVGAVFSKGLVGLAFSAVFFAFWVVWTRSWKEILRAQPWLGILIIGSLLGAWLYFLGTRGSLDYVKTFLIDNNLLRFVPSAGAYYGSHVNPFYFYALTFWTAFIPWSVFTPAVFVFAWRARKTDANRLFFLLWLASAFLLLSAAGTKRQVYLAPLAPAFAVLVALYFRDLRYGAKGGLARLFEIIFLAMALSSPAVYTVLAAQAHMCKSPLFIVFFVLLAAQMTIFLFHYRRRRAFSVAAIAAYSFVGFIAFAATFFTRYNAEESYRPTSLAIKKILDAEKGAVLYAAAPSEISRGSIPFYTGYYMVPIWNMGASVAGDCCPSRIAT